MNALSNPTPIDDYSSPLPRDIGDLWRAYRAEKAVACRCGRGHLALSVLSSPRSYCFQCVACHWQSGWFHLPA